MAESEMKRLRRELDAAKREVDRLQRVLDSRPAHNAGLPGSYIVWSNSIYAMEMERALSVVSGKSGGH